jgi:hypothetical protein
MLAAVGGASRRSLCSPLRESRCPVLARVPLLARGFALGLTVCAAGYGVWLWLQAAETDRGVRLAFPDPAVIQAECDATPAQLRITDSAGVCVFSGVLRNDDESLPIAWRPGETYVAEVDGDPPQRFQAPARQPRWSITVHAPIGAEPRQHFVYEDDDTPADLLFALPTSATRQARVLVEIEWLAENVNSGSLRDVRPGGIRCSRLRRACCRHVCTGKSVRQAVLRARDRAA